MDHKNGLEAVSASSRIHRKENPSRKSSFGASIPFVREKKSKAVKHDTTCARSSDEELSCIELEGPPSNSTKKRSSSWRFPVMFTKSQNNPKPVPSKQSVFPNNGNILKKKARSTILSVLSKRQTQEKLFLGEKSDVHENTSVSSSEPTFPQTKWPSEAMIVELSATKPAPQRPTSFAVKNKTYHYAPPNQGLNSSESNDRVYTENENEQGKFSSRVEAPYVAQAGLDVLDGGSTNVGQMSLRWPPQQQNESLGWRRASAPKHLSCPPDMEHTVQVSDAMVVSMSPSFTSVKDISPDSPLSPKSETDSVRVSIPFQVQGQHPQAAKPDQRSDAWSSSVSICVPFQVNENNEGVSVLPSRPSIPEDSGSTMNSLLVPDARASKDERDRVTVTKPRPHFSPQSGRRKPPKEPHSKDKKVTKDSPKTMGKEASKPHKPMDKAVSSTPLKVPATGGKPRSRSFNLGDRAKLAPSPTGTPPTGTPKSSPGNSPKPARRNAMSKDMGKKRPSELKKQDQHGRPHSDPLIAEKVNNKKKSTGVPVNDTASGKSKPDTETPKNKVKNLEQENNELKEKIQPMEQRLAVVSILEKEKLHLQKQVNDISLENDKRKTELESLNLLSKKQIEERDEIQVRHDKLTTAFESSQTEVKELKHQNQILEEDKSNLMRENEEKLEAIGKYLDNIENLTSSNTALVLQDGRSRSKISTLLQGLKSLKDCVVKLKEENEGLHLQIIENGMELAGTIRKCVSGLEKVLDSLEEKKNDKIDKETQVSISIENKDTQCDDSQSVDLILAQLEKSKQSVKCLKNRINELEKENESNVEKVENVEDESCATQNDIRKDAQSTVDEEVNGENKVTDCGDCSSLQMQVQALSVELEMVKGSLQKSESERDDALEERNELRREAKYLKYVLSYREDVQNLQNTNQQAKELEKMGTNLVEAEKKVVDLEEEVGRLQEEKQTLLLSILNLYSGNEVEDVKEEEEDEGEAENKMASENNEENKKQESKENVSEVFEKSPSAGLSPRTPDSTSRREQLKFRFQLSLSESEYSYSSDRTEGDDELSDSEAVTSPSELSVQAIKTENKELKSNLFEANEEKEELLSSLDKLCEEYDALKETHDKLEENHRVLSDQARKDKIAYQSRLRQIEMDRENMRDTLRQVQDEKLALLKCLEMKNSATQPMSPLPDLDLDNIIARAQSFAQEENNSSDLDLEKIIARAQSFTREENESSDLDLDKIIARAQLFSREETKSSEPTSNEEYSEASSSSETEDDVTEPTSNKDALEKKADDRVGFKTPATQSSTTVDRDLAGIVASIENDLGILKARLYTRDSDTPGDGQESRPRKPPPGERILKRQASTVKSNLDRVSREKQHLQDEVESLRRYLLKRRDSAMDLRKKPSRRSFRKDASEVENHLEGIKTLQALLGKSDEQLRQSNVIITRLEAVNDETEEKLRDAEVLREDMRRAVQIANNFAMEEQQKAEKLVLQNQELLKQIKSLKSKGAAPDQKDASDYSKVEVTPKSKSKIGLKVLKSYTRSVSEDDYEDEESIFTTEGESDFYSSRHSSIASESELRSPREPSEDNMETLSDNLDSNLVSPSGQESTKSLDTEPEGGTSQHSSTLDTSDTE